jgi:endonuclease YncB( thermonuclease family)
VSLRQNGVCPEKNCADAILPKGHVWLKMDRFKRPLGTVLLGSVNVNLSQIQQGFAWYFKRYAADVPEIERLQYEAAEVEARESKRGLSSHTHCHFTHKVGHPQFW